MKQMIINLTYVFFNVVQATIVRDESSNLFAVLDQLNSGTFTDGRVRLLSLNTTAESNNKLRTKSRKKVRCIG